MRLLALDIDETLTGRNHEIGRPNAEAVAWAQAQGIKVTLITGRRYTSSAATFAEALSLAGPIACHYGRRLVRHPSGEIIRSHPLPPGSALTLADTALELPGAIVSAFIDDELVFESFPRNWPRSAFVQISEGDLRARLTARPAEIMSLSISSEDAADPTRAARIVSEAGARLYPGLLQFYFIPWAGVPRRLATGLSSAADKGTALAELAELAGVDLSETVAMGDSEADIPMLRAAGIGVAMPWAAEDVRRAADLVAEGDPEDAVARTIRRLA
jgi:HAD superfamily hydrolase (TIGR01484 family)